MVGGLGDRMALALLGETAMLPSTSKSSLNIAIN